jgi:replicative DNA helicase
MAEESTFKAAISQIPPQNIEVEEAILGGIMLDPEAIGRVAEKLVPEAFYVNAHKIIYQAALALNSQSKPTDLISLSDWLSDRKQLEEVGGQSKLFQLVERTVSAVNIDSLAVLAMDKYLRREVIRAGTEVVQLGYDTAQPLEVVLDKSEQQVLNLTQGRSKPGLTPIREIVVNTYQDIEARYTQLTSPGLTCDFADLDAMTAGFQRSDLIIIAGRPSMGKTAISLNIAYNMALLHKLPILIFSLEMSKEQLVQRLLASEAGVDSNRLRAGRISQNEIDRILQAVDKISELPIYIEDNANTMVMEMRSQARKLQAEHGGKLGLIMIDYLQLMEGGGDNRVQELSKITRSLKGLARELGVPLIALSQLSRSVEARNNKRPMMSDLRESGCLAGDSLVTLADSGLEVPIRELVGKSGFAVWGINPETMKQEKAIATNAFCTGIKPIWEMATTLGNTIKATANHKFYTLDGWKRLDELSVGDRIALPRYIPCATPALPNGVKVSKMSNAELALLGHLIGDGCTLPRHAIQYTTKEFDLAEIVAKLAKEVFGNEIEPRINSERNWYQVYLSASYHLTHNLKNPITIWLEALGVFGLRSHEKFIPNLIFTQPQESLAIFLKHLWATDGCIRASNKNHYPNIYYASSSERLARGVKSLLLRFDIHATIRAISQGSKGRKQYHVCLSGKADLEKFVDIIGAVGDYKQSSLDAVKIYLENSGRANTNRDLISNQIWRTKINDARVRIGLTTRQMQERIGVSYCGTSLYKYDLSRERAYQLATILDSEELLKLAVSDIYWDEIKSIEFIGEEMVYDLTIDKIENFVVQGIYAHNSIEQDADLIIMLYRDAYYNPDTPDRDATELIITKHRNGPTGTVKLVFDPTLTKFKNMALSHS